ncbi:MAG: hypothetical protein NTY38_20710 [Acidobacteria bacterium]|nr:hypothetical protein [Acidobacteriota bacterium]
MLLVLTAILIFAANLPLGLPVGVVSRYGYPPGTLCVEQRIIIVRVGANRELHINAEPVTRAALHRRLEELFATRAERVAFVLGAPELSYGEVAEVVAIVRQTVGNVGLLTASTIPTQEQPLLYGPFPLKTRWD